MANQESKTPDPHRELICSKCGQVCRGTRALRTHLMQRHGLSVGTANKLLETALPSPGQVLRETAEVAEKLEHARRLLACIQSVGSDAASLADPIGERIESLEHKLQALGREWSEASRRATDGGPKS